MIVFLEICVKWGTDQCADILYEHTCISDPPRMSIILHASEIYRKTLPFIVVFACPAWLQFTSSHIMHGLAINTAEATLIIFWFLCWQAPVIPRTQFYMHAWAILPLSLDLGLCLHVKVVFTYSSCNLLAVVFSSSKPSYQNHCWKLSVWNALPTATVHGWLMSKYMYEIWTQIACFFYAICFSETCIATFW